MIDIYDEGSAICSGTVVGMERFMDCLMCGETIKLEINVIYPHEILHMCNPCFETLQSLIKEIRENRRKFIERECGEGRLTFE